MPLPRLHALLPLPLAPRKRAARRGPASLPRAHLRALLSLTGSRAVHLSRYSASRLSALHLRVLPPPAPHATLRLAPLPTPRAAAVWRALHLHLPDRHDLRRVPAAPTPHLVVHSLSALTHALRAVHRARGTTAPHPSPRSEPPRTAAWELAAALVLSHAVQRRLRLTGTRQRPRPRPTHNVRWACEWMMREEGGASATVCPSKEDAADADHHADADADRFLVDMPLRIAKGVAVRVRDGLVEIRVDRTKALRLENVRVRRETESGLEVLRPGRRGRAPATGAVVEAASKYERLGKAMYLD